MESILKLQADVCKIFANDKRLEMINLLKDKEMSNSELMQKTGLSNTNSGDITLNYLRIY